MFYIYIYSRTSTYEINSFCSESCYVSMSTFYPLNVLICSKPPQNSDIILYKQWLKLVTINVKISYFIINRKVHMERIKNRNKQLI